MKDKFVDRIQKTARHYSAKGIPQAVANAQAVHEFWKSVDRMNERYTLDQIGEIIGVSGPRVGFKLRRWRHEWQYHRSPIEQWFTPDLDEKRYKFFKVVRDFSVLAGAME